MIEKLDEDEPEILLDCQRLFVACSAFLSSHISRFGSLSLDVRHDKIKTFGDSPYAPIVYIIGGLGGFALFSPDFLNHVFNYILPSAAVNSPSCRLQSHSCNPMNANGLWNAGQYILNSWRNAAEEKLVLV